MQTSLSNEHKILELSFIPEEYKEKFIQSIFDHYFSAAEIIGPGNMVKEQPFPEVTNDLAFGMVELFLIGSLYQESDNPYAFSNVIEDTQNKGGDIADVYEELFEDYGSPGITSVGYTGMFIDDITAVLDHYTMSYTFIWTQPISGVTYYSYEHVPGISVW